MYSKHRVQRLVLRPRGSRGAGCPPRARRTAAGCPGRCPGRERGSPARRRCRSCRAYQSASRVASSSALDVEDDGVRPDWAGKHARSLRAKPLTDRSVVPPDARRSRPIEDRDGDDHHPRARRRTSSRTTIDGHERRSTAAPTPLSAALQPPPPFALAEPVPDHPGLRQCEGGEDADHVQVDQRVHVRAEGDDQQPPRRRRG